MKNIFIVFIWCLLLCFFGISTLYSQNYGDANDDGQVNIIDALITAQHYVGFNPDPFNAANADVDGQNGINIIDALLIAQYYVGLIIVFPVQTTTDMEIVQSDLERNMAPQLETGEFDSVVEGNNRFAFDCFQQLKSEQTNLFYSPVSISFAMAMAYAGANSNTEAEIANAMHFTLPEDRFHNAFNALDLTLTSKPTNPNPYMGEDIELHIVNSTWGQKDYVFQTPFLDILAVNYGAGLNIVDFNSNPDGCRLLINDWVSDQTEQRINDLLPVGSIGTLTRLVLVNAIYFKALWMLPFNEEKTEDGPFYLQDGSVVTTPLMHHVLHTGYYEVPGQYQAVKLDYQGTNRNSMIIILPAAGQLTAFEDNFSYDTFMGIYQGLGQYKVTLTLPKFSYEWGKPLKSAFQAMGMTDAFDYQMADFSGITTIEQIYISDIFHKAFVSVDELGTEAAAATAVVFSGTGVPDPVTMTIERPFIFLLCNDDTGTILFVGRVLVPEL